MPNGVRIDLFVQASTLCLRSAGELEALQNVMGAGGNQAEMLNGQSASCGLWSPS